MKAIVLLAGIGERLLPITKYTHKCLIDLGDGSCVLDRIISNIHDCEFIDEIILVTGHMWDKVEERLAKLNVQIKINTIYNPLYSVCNNLISLWCARDRLLEDDFIITNGDNYYESVVLRNISRQRDSIQLTIDKKDCYTDDDMKVSMDKDGNIVRISKDIENEIIAAESVGLLLVQGSEKRRIFYDVILDVVKNRKMLDAYWLEVVNRLIVDGHTVDSYEISSLDWWEIDFKADLDELKEIILRSTLRKCDLRRG